MIFKKCNQLQLLLFSAREAECKYIQINKIVVSDRNVKIKAFY